LLSFTEMGESVLEWYPILQDYYWKVTVGVEISKLSFEVYFNQYCLHAIDRYVPEINNEYNGLGCSLTLKL
jgi:hypothetical protein